MFNRSSLLRLLVAAIVIFSCAGIYLFVQLQPGMAGALLGDREETIAADDSAGIDPPADSLTPEFTALFGESFTFDTVGGTSGSFIIDTSLQAVPREGLLGGRKVSIAVCGVDSRLNERVEHADANHVVTVWLDSGIVDIVAIPRDTPSDAGYHGRPSLNILSNVRAHKGREAYLKEVAAIAGLDTIEYYVELGFSQARGVLELLGFKNDAVSALRVLRARQAFSAGDFQRCFNQGQFIRQMMLRQFGRLDGVSGNLLMRAGLFLVTTNLTLEVVDSLRAALARAGFPKSKECVTVSIKPSYYAKMAVFNFADSAVLGNLLRKIDEKERKDGGKKGGPDSTLVRFRSQVHALIAKAASDTEKTPVRVIANLRRAFEQRVWWQLSDGAERREIRAALGGLLSHAYAKTGRADEAERVRSVVEFEERVFTEKNEAGGR